MSNPTDLQTADQGPPTDAEVIAAENELVETAGPFFDKALRFGDLLNRKKRALPHGEFHPWVDATCQMSHRSAQTWMRVARHRLELEAANAQSVNKALTILTAPDDDSEDEQPAAWERPTYDPTVFPYHGLPEDELPVIPGDRREDETLAAYMERRGETDRAALPWRGVTLRDYAGRCQMADIFDDQRRRLLAPRRLNPADPPMPKAERDRAYEFHAKGAREAFAPLKALMEWGEKCLESESWRGEGFKCEKDWYDANPHVGAVVSFWHAVVHSDDEVVAA